ncbi:MAG: GspH/FimT family pseudopilin [Gammaproteobacteria bacterium]|nr:GspH/FimT family pseudopilin [Gammaproteobacteria bacterium]MDH5730139.1 GspH/FimT family pseudopilin [Gammaproteobacteria bacterium]
MKNFDKAGFTLIELLIIMTVVIIMLGIGVPSMTDMFERRKLKNTLEVLNSEIMLIRSEAVLRNANVYMSVSTSVPWCIGFTLNAAGCDCKTANACQIDSRDRIIIADDNPGISIQSTIATATFSPTGPVDNTGTITVNTNRDNLTANIQINPVGRLRICTDDVPGYLADGNC